MSEQRVFSLRNPWFTWSVSTTIAIAVVGILIGFIWLPSTSTAFRGQSLWAMICGAAGAPSSWYSGAGAESAVPSQVVVLPPWHPTRARADSIGRGATIATQYCSMCHGALGTTQNIAPALAGQYVDVIYKELRDYQTGKRESAVMQAIIASRSEQDLQDLAAYYASLDRAPAAEPAHPGEHPDATALRLVMQGDPKRNIAPCASCHGELDRKGAAPWLGGQSATFTAEQLRLFATGERHNDINAQMRNVARELTPEEIDALANYYAQVR